MKNKNKEERWYNDKRDKVLRRYFTPRIQRELQGCKDNAQDIIKDNMYLSGAVNTGKTIRICKKLLNTIFADYMKGTPRTYRFIDLSEMIAEIKLTFDSPNMTEWQVIREYGLFDILVIDDFMAQRITPWVYQTLYIIINNRYENLKPTGYTSNLSIEELIEQLQDERIPRRIQSKIKPNKENRF